MSAVVDLQATEERMVREIMAVDSLSWDDAQPALENIRRANRECGGLRNLFAKTYYKSLAVVSSHRFVRLSIVAALFRVRVIRTGLTLRWAGLSTPLLRPFDLPVV